MPHLSRPYRFTAALVVVGFTLGLLTPAVHSVCAMMMDHSAMPAHHAAPAPCLAPATDALFSTTNQHETEACCTMQAPAVQRLEQAILRTASSQQLAAPPLLLLTSFLFVDEPEGTAPLREGSHFLSSSPPALHVLHAAFLN